MFNALNLVHPQQLLERIKNSGQRFFDKLLNTRYLKTHDPFVINRELTRYRSPIFRNTLIDCSIEEDEQNPYYTGLLNTLANHCCGKIPIPVCLIENDALCDAVEDRFQEWGVENGIGAAIRELRRTAARSGIGVAIPYKMKTEHEIKLGFQVVGAEYLRSPPFKPEVIDGVEFWPNSTDIKAVWIQEEGKDEPTQFLEKDIIIFARKRVHKFWPECSSAFQVYPSIRRYMQSALKTAEMQTSIPMALELDPNVWPAGSAGPEGKYEYEPGWVPTLPPGTKLSGLNFAQVSEDRSKFVDLMVGTAARCIDMPTILALADSSDSNMATAHIDLQPWSYAVEIDRYDFERAVRKIFRLWYDLASLWPGYLPSTAMNYEKPPIIFHYSVLFQHPDPVKRAMAREADLRSGASTLTRIYSQDGLTARREIRKECKLLGISTKEFYKLILSSRSKAVNNASNTSSSKDQNDPQRKESKAA